MCNPLYKYISDYLSEETNEKFIFSDMTSTITNKALNTFKNKNSSGPDKISTNLLQSIMPVIINPICHLFNQSFKSALFQKNHG